MPVMQFERGKERDGSGRGKAVEAVTEDDDVLRWFVQGGEEGWVGHEAGDLVGVFRIVGFRARFRRCL